MTAKNLKIALIVVAALVTGHSLLAHARSFLGALSGASRSYIPMPQIYASGVIDLARVAGWGIVYFVMVRNGRDRLTAAAWGAGTTLVTACLPGPIFGVVPRWMPWVPAFAWSAIMVLAVLAAPFIALGIASGAQGAGKAAPLSTPQVASSAKGAGMPAHNVKVALVKGAVVVNGLLLCLALLFLLPLLFDPRARGNEWSGLWLLGCLVGVLADLACVAGGVIVYRRMLRDRDRLTAAAWGAGTTLAAPCAFLLLWSVGLLSGPSAPLVLVIVVAAPFIALRLARTPR